MATLTTTFAAGMLKASYSRSLAGQTQKWEPLFPVSIITLPTGTASGQANLLYTATRNIAASGNDDLDLTSGLTDAFGTALVFVKVKAIYVRADSANNTANNVVVGAAASNAFLAAFADATDKVSLTPGGIFQIVHPTTGWTVDGTHKILRVANSAGTNAVNYDIAIVGTDA